jgi:O-antigen ligase
VVLAVVVTLTGALALTETAGRSRVEQLVTPAVGSRLTIWEAGADALGEAGLTGYGLYGFTPYAEAAGRVENHPHNLELAGFGMFGLIGGALYLGWWLAALWRTLRGPDAMTIGLPLLALFLHAQLDAWTFHLPFDLTAVLLVGLAVAREPGWGVVTLGPGAAARRVQAGGSAPSRTGTGATRR